MQIPLKSREPTLSPVHESREEGSRYIDFGKTLSVQSLLSSTVYNHNSSSSKIKSVPHYNYDHERGSQQSKRSSIQIFEVGSPEKSQLSYDVIL